MSRRQRFTFRIGMCATVLAVACGRDATLTDEGVSTAGATRNANVWRIEEVLRLGDLDGAGPTVFGRIGALEVGPDRNLIVFDALAQELRVFTHEGAHQWSFGRPGNGPGEFGNVLGVASAPDGSIWLVDGRNDRYTIVGRDGSFVSHPRASRVVRRPWTAGFDLNGFFYDYAIELHAGGADLVMLQVSTTGEVMERFAIPDIDVPQPQFGGGITTELPFATRALRAWDRKGGVWQARSSEYRIANVTLNSDTVLVVARDVGAMPLTAADRDSVDAAIQRVERVLIGQTVDPRFRPEAVPPLRWFTPDDEDRLWVCATGIDPCSRLDVFGGDGSFLGTVQLPGPVLDLPTPIVRDGHLYAAMEGELGVPQVFVGRVVIPQ
jgi:hypothetical protein